LTAGDCEIRPMREGEEATVAQLAHKGFIDLDRRLGNVDPPPKFHRRVVRRTRRWLGRREPPEPPWRVARRVGRFEHLRTTDPDGSWVAVRDGAVVGSSVALVRDGVWGLSLLMVAPEMQGTGIGGPLMQCALGYADGARGGLILSSLDTRAVRVYARAGFAVEPCVQASGEPRRDRLPDFPDVRAGDKSDLPLCEAVSREVRGATHDPDLRWLLDTGSKLLVMDGRGYAVYFEERLELLAARDEDAARQLLIAALRRVPPGRSVEVEHLSARQQWAIATCVDVGLDLRPTGPICWRGAVGSMTPYLPTGAFL
jgi:GNAT superfamily N-acetyltransferase